MKQYKVEITKEALCFNWFSDAHPFELIVMERQISVVDWMR